jgi:hypothetical protein
MSVNILFSTALLSTVYYDPSKFPVCPPHL